MTFGAVVFGDVVFGAIDSSKTSSITVSLTTSWNVLRNINKTLTIDYRVYNLINRTYIIEWGITEPLIGINLETIWNIESPITITTTKNKFKLPATSRSKTFCG